MHGRLKIVSWLQGILINGQFPGPDIYSVTNDNLIINVHNSLSEPFLLSWLVQTLFFFVMFSFLVKQAFFVFDSCVTQKFCWKLGSTLEKRGFGLECGYGKCTNLVSDWRLFMMAQITGMVSNKGGIHMKMECMEPHVQFLLARTLPTFYK